MQNILQTDGAWSSRNKRAGIGWNLFKCASKELQGKGGQQFTVASSALHAELLALLKGLVWVKEQGLIEVEVWTDSNSIVS